MWYGQATQAMKEFKATKGATGIRLINIEEIEND